MSCWLWHKWNKWEAYIQSGTVIIRWAKDQTPKNYNELRQRRTCKDCGKMEDQKV